MTLFTAKSVCLAQQMENEGKMRMLLEFVNMSTRKYGISQLPAEYTRILPVPCLPSEQFMLLLQGHCKPVTARRWKVMTVKKEA